MIKHQTLSRAVFAAKSRGIAARKRSRTPNKVTSPQTESSEADYAVVRPTDVAEDDDVSNDYAYPSASASASIPGDDTSKYYLSLLSEPDESLRLVTVFTRPETDIFTSVSGAADDATEMATTVDSGIHFSDAHDSVVDEEKPAMYMEILSN